MSLFVSRTFNPEKHKSTLLSTIPASQLYHDLKIPFSLSFLYQVRLSVRRTLEMCMSEGGRLELGMNVQAGRSTGSKDLESQSTHTNTHSHVRPFRQPRFVRCRRVRYDATSTFHGRVVDMSLFLDRIARMTVQRSL